MDNDDRSVFERLDTIEDDQAAIQEQNAATQAKIEEILSILTSSDNNQPVNQNVTSKPQPQPTKQQLLQKFIRSSKKEHIWLGTKFDFNQSQTAVIILSICLMIVGVISTVLTSIAFKMYSTFTLFENIWLVFACILFSYAMNAKKRMLDTDLKDHSNTIFVQDVDGTWRDTNKEKKRFKWFRTLSYIAVACNIIVIWIQSKGAIALFATLFELAFVGLTIGLYFAYINLFCMYGIFILFTGVNPENHKTITIIFDVEGKKLAPYEEYKEKFKDHL